jgi:hypothetical protein
MMAQRGYSSGSSPGKKSRFLVNYECHQFLSRSHCGRHGGTLPSHVAEGEESAEGRQIREREGHPEAAAAALL